MKAIGHTDKPMATALAIARRLNYTINIARVLVVFIVDQLVFAANADSDTAQALNPELIVGVYTRRATPVDIEADISAWRAAA